MDTDNIGDASGRKRKASTDISRPTAADSEENLGAKSNMSSEETRVNHVLTPTTTAGAGGEAPASSSLVASGTSAMGQPEVAICPKCSHSVPISNLVVHEANCNRVRGRRPSIEQQSLPSQSQTPEQPASQPQPSAMQTTGGWRSFIAASTPPSTAAASATESDTQGNHVEMDSNVGNIRPSTQSRIEEMLASADSLLEMASQMRQRAAVTADGGNASDSTILAAAPATSPPSPSASSLPNSQNENQINSNNGSTTNATSTANQNLNQNESNDIHLQAGQWSCPRCTLINNSHDSNCDACLLPRTTLRTSNNNAGIRPPDSNRRGRPSILPTLRQMQPTEDGWVRVTHQNRARNEDAVNEGNGNNANNNNSSNNNGRTTRQRFNTASRVFNGALNGAIVGSIFGGLGGMVLGGIGGLAAGVMADNAVRRREEQMASDMDREVDELMRNGVGGESLGVQRPGTVRIHHGGGHILAVSVDENGRRIIRIPRSRNNQQLPRDSTQRAEAGGQQVADLERRLAELLMRMSYLQDNVPHNNGNIIFQPDATFEELLDRFGTGTENRGASQEVIDSYPVEVVGRESNDNGERNKTTCTSSTTLSSSSLSNTDNTTAAIDMGACGICLEDFENGDTKKKLACSNRPHAFHKDCIDKWLKLVASCPICKNEVGMFQQASANTEGGMRKEQIG